MEHSDVTRAVAAPTAAQLAAAERAVGDVLVPTPLVDGLKLETLQPTGSFKVRGGLAGVAAAPPGARIVTASAGNHGLGVAWAAQRLGRAATIVVPANASAAKVARLRTFAVELILHGDGYDAAEAHALSLGGHYLSPYNDPDVIAGQRTVAVELGEQTGGPFTVIVPVGGGGLLAGAALWAAGRDDVRVVGVEVRASPGMTRAIAAGGVVPIEVGPSLADGMVGGLEPGSVTVDIAAAHVDAFVAVTEDELRAGMRDLVTAHGVVAEGAGAAAHAAVLAGKADGIRIVSGRNVTVETLRDVLTLD